MALAEHLGDPTDSYVNGSQVWLRDNGPRQMTLEWRLHPVAHYVKPKDIEIFDIFPLMALGLAENGNDAELPAPLSELWDGLEVFPAFDDETEPHQLALTAQEAIGIAPLASGLVDHDHIGETWEKTSGAISITDELLGQLIKK